MASKSTGEKKGDVFYIEQIMTDLAFLVSHTSARQKKKLRAMNYWWTVSCSVSCKYLKTVTNSLLRLKKPILIYLGENLKE